jgi:hypothetical protein
MFTGPDLYLYDFLEHLMTCFTNSTKNPGPKHGLSMKVTWRTPAFVSLNPHQTTLVTIIP